MNSVLKWVVAVTAITAASVAPGHAQTAGGYLLSNSSTITVGSGWSFQITACTYTVNGVNAANCSGEEVIPTVVGNTLSLVYENVAGTGTPLLTSNSVSSNNNLDVTVNVAKAGGLLISSGTDTIIGSTTSTGFATVGETISGTTATPGMIAGLNYAGAINAATFTPTVSNLTSGDDLGAYSGKISFSGSSSVTSFTNTYTAAPEPFSITLLGVGVAGLGFVRRKTRRSA
jgi:hypothetical protein